MLRSLIPGQPADPRIRDLKRVARLTLTTWILIVVPLLLAELALIVVNAPTMARTSAVSRPAIAAAAAGRQIRVGNDDTLAASALPSFTTVAADGVGGQHSFNATRSVRARYVLIWFTRLPPVSPATYQAQIFSIVLHSSR